MIKPWPWSSRMQVRRPLLFLEAGLANGPLISTCFRVGWLMAIKEIRPARGQWPGPLTRQVPTYMEDVHALRIIRTSPDPYPSPLSPIIPYHVTGGQRWPLCFAARCFLLRPVTDRYADDLRRQCATATVMLARPSTYFSTGAVLTPPCLLCSS